jgi:hypothetical protein
MALSLHAQVQPAHQALGWLTANQSSDGSLGVNATEKQPCWPTGWAVLAWRLAGAAYATAAGRAVQWILALRGKSQPQTPLMGHNMQLQAWPWVEGTHSWVEPTAINLMALKRAGQAEHARCREAVAMLLDRMLPAGGWNYGNKVVLGNTLRPHVQPTGLALAALAGEPTAASACQRSLAYLTAELSPRTTTASLCYGLIGVGLHGHRPPEANAWLEAACRRTLSRDASPYKLALLVIAAAQSSCPWHVAQEVSR